MFLLANAREQLLPHLPKGAHVAEVGVNLAEFSRLILDQCQPAKLHLIDPWEMSHADDDYTQGGGETAQAEDRYAEVLERVGPELDQGVVEIHRAYSQDAIGDFADNSLDWVYIDGNHQYEFVKQDLEMFLPKLKDDGLILGHDYARNDLSRKFNFGVVEAVNEVVEGHGLEFMFLTFDPFPTYLLAKSSSHPRVQALLANVLYHLKPVVQINNFTRLGYQQLTVDFGENRYKPIISVG